VKFTNAKFYRVNGSSTQIKGITPDIIFPSFTDSMDIGEKNLDYALPWDSINAVEHDNYSRKLQYLIPLLKKRSISRRASDPAFKRLVNDIKSYENMRKRKLISLNEQKRWAEYMREKEIQDEQKKLMHLDSSANKQEKDSGGHRDLYLDESEKIMTDMIKFMRAKKETCGK
jgi:carboxyl-terminal processing protease